MPITPQDFVSKCKRVTAREKQTYQGMISGLDMFYKSDAK
jgi:hypothetical protein